MTTFYVRRTGSDCILGGARTGDDSFFAHPVQVRVARMATPTPKTVVIAAAPNSAITESSGTSFTTVSRIAVDQAEPIAHRAPVIIANRKDLMTSPRWALSWKLILVAKCSKKNRHISPNGFIVACLGRINPRKNPLC